MNIMVKNYLGVITWATGFYLDLGLDPVLVLEEEEEEEEEGFDGRFFQESSLAEGGEEEDFLPEGLGLGLVTRGLAVLGLDVIQQEDKIRHTATVCAIYFLS